jgi:hypothetical protein
LKLSEGVTYDALKDQFEAEITANINANEDTSTKHSTIGEIKIDFVNADDRFNGCWSKQADIPINAQDEVYKQVQGWLNEKIIEELIDLKRWNKRPITGLFNTNGFLTFSGKWRFVHNFAPINRLIKGDINDLPFIDTIFRTIGNAECCYFTKIDLRSAYLQVLLREADRDITVFTVGNRRFRFITAIRP